MSTIKLELSVEEAQAMRQGTCTCATPTRESPRCALHRGRDKLKAALAAHEREEKRRLLMLPWHAISTHALHNGHGAARFSTQQARDLALAAPDLAEACENALDFLDSTGHGPDNGGVFDMLTAALKKSGWQ